MTFTTQKALLANQYQTANIIKGLDLAWKERLRIWLPFAKTILRIIFSEKKTSVNRQ